MKQQLHLVLALAVALAAFLPVIEGQTTKGTKAKPAAKKKSGCIVC